MAQFKVEAPVGTSTIEVSLPQGGNLTIVLHALEDRPPFCADMYRRVDDCTEPMAVRVFKRGENLFFSNTHEEKATVVSIDL